MTDQNPDQLAEQPVRRALAIAALSQADEILVDLATADGAAPSGYTLRPAEDVISRDGAAMDLMALRAEALEEAGNV